MSARSFQHELLRMSFYKAAPVSAVPPYTIPHRTEVIELVTDGVVYFESDGRDRKFGCGALFWHVAGDQTIHRTEAAQPYRCLALSFTALPRRERPAPRLSVILDAPRTKELCQEFLRASHVEAVDRRILGTYIRSRLLWEAHLGTIQNSMAIRPAPVETVLAFLESEFRRTDLSVQHLAEAAEISEPHLHTLFRQHLGQTPHQFLNARRMREAQWLLSGTNRAIKAIATDCGFLNIETFYRGFKQAVGTTPNQFRRSHSGPILAQA